MKLQPLMLRVQITADRELLARERKSVENRLKAALARATTDYILQISEVPDPTLGGAFPEAAAAE